MKWSYFIIAILLLLLIGMVILVVYMGMKKQPEKQCPQSKPCEPCKPCEFECIGYDDSVEDMEDYVPSKPEVKKETPQPQPEVKKEEPKQPEVKPEVKREQPKPEPSYVDAILDEVNLARTKPQEYAKILRDYKGWTFEGQDKSEAINFLMSQTPLPPIKYNNDICERAGEPWLKQLLGSGQFGHGSWKQRWGDYGCYFQESLGAGTKMEARDNVISWIVDPGFPGKGHRKHLFNDKAISGCSIMKRSSSYPYGTLIGYYTRNEKCNF